MNEETWIMGAVVSNAAAGRVGKRRTVAGEGYFTAVGAGWQTCRAGIANDAAISGTATRRLRGGRPVVTLGMGKVLGC